MTRRSTLSNEQGFALFYMAVFLTVLLIFVGLAVDTGRAYVVQAQLSKAVDGAALGAARMLNSGNPRQEAANIYRANFPNGYMGTTSSTDPNTDGSFFAMSTISATGVNVVDVRAEAVVPTTFMKLANFSEVRVRASGQATRRLVDLSLVIDVSSSIGWRWPYVRDASRAFVDGFSGSLDRVSLIFFGNGARVIDQMPPGRGFDKPRVMADIPNGLPGGSTAMVQGLFRGWDEVRTVPAGQQSSLRIIVLFTDGCSNSVPGIYPEVAAGVSRGLRTWDFPDNGADPDGQTHANPNVDGLYDTVMGNASPSTSMPGGSMLSCTCVPAGKWCCETSKVTAPPAALAVPWMPVEAYISNSRSSGMRTTFPLVSPMLMVDGAAQSTRRPMTGATGPSGRYVAKVTNINNAARNLVEIIANEARSDATGDYPIRIYTIGMGELVTYLLGSRQEPGSDILKRVANDRTSVDFNSAQLEGKYYFAQTEQDVSDAFQQLQNQIIRLTK
jgi:Flp pilus assembly protein TadG